MIDPALIFSTWLKGNCVVVAFSSCGVSVKDMAVDGTGIYITGSTTAAVFPATKNSTVAPPVAPRTFVVKLDPTGSQILYTTSLADSSVQSVSVDTVGSAYVTGVAVFPPPNGGAPFPTTPGAFSSAPPSGTCSFPNFGPCTVPFATKLSPDGSALVYSILLQQFSTNGQTSGDSIWPSRAVVDTSGAVYVTGAVGQVDRVTLMPFPVTVGAYQTTPSPGFVMKVNPSGSGLDYATYLAESPPGIAIDPGGAAYIPEPNVGVSKLTPDGSALAYSASYNGSIVDIAVDPAGEAVIVGSGSNPPTTPNAFCTPPNPSLRSAFVAKFNASGSGLVYSTTLCGNDSQAQAVAVDAAGAAYVAATDADPESFPVTSPIQAYPLSPTHEVVAKIDTSGALQWATFLGSGSSEGLSAGGCVAGLSCVRVAVDPAGAAYFLGVADLQTPNALGPDNSGFAAATTLAKIAPSLGAPVPVFIPTTVSFASTAVGASAAAVDVVLGNFGDAVMSPASISITGDFTETDNCSSSVPGGQKCDVNVTFSPTAGGTRTGILTAQTGGAMLTVSLSGTGASAMASFAPTSLTFPAQPVGTTSPTQQVVITNGGTFPLTITSIATTGDFAATNTCGSAIAPNGTCTVQVTFTPTALGARSGTLNIADNAPGSPQTVALVGSPQSLGLSVPSGGSSSSTVAAGSTASYTLAIGGGGVAGNAALTCTGAPTGATCVVPASTTISASSSTTFMVTVSTTSRTLSALRGIEKAPGSWMWATLLLGVIVWPGTGSKKGKARSWFGGLAIFVLMLSSCGGGSQSPSQPQPNPNGTPAGMYTLTVNATSGSMSQSMPLTLTVQ